RAGVAEGPSGLTGIGHLRRHETDRLAALATEIGALGGDVTELDDGLEIRPRALRATGRPFASYDDHRLVMAAAVLGLAVPGIEVANPATVGKTFPALTQLWASMLERVPCPRAPGTWTKTTSGCGRGGAPARAPGAGPRTRARWRASSPPSTGAGTASRSVIARSPQCAPASWAAGAWSSATRWR